jgi:hypothetical protein
MYVKPTLEVFGKVGQVVLGTIPGSEVGQGTPSDGIVCGVDD